MIRRLFSASDFHHKRFLDRLFQVGTTLLLLILWLQAEPFETKLS